MSQALLFANDASQLRAPLAPEERWRIDECDATAWLGGLEEESVDLVITDPAYESLEKHRAKGTTTRLKVSDASSNEWFPIFPNSRFPDLFEQVYRVLRRDSHFYMYCDQETAFAVKHLAEAVGFKFWKPLVWDKTQIGMGYHYRATYELVLFFEKGKRKLNDLGTSDILRCKPVRGRYPTEKPVEVSTTLIRQSTSADAIVADPFSGSASTGEAAIRSDRRFVGCDVKAGAVELGRARLGAL